MTEFKLLDETYYYGVDTSSFEMGETTSDYYDNYFPFPLNSNTYGGEEPFQVGGKFGINFVSHSNSRVKLCDYKFTLDEDGTALWIEFVSTNTNIDGLTIPFYSNNDLSCAGINQKIWNYLYKIKAGKDIATTNALFNSITHIKWEEWVIYGILDIYYKNTDEKILSTDIEYYGYVEDICKVFTVYLNAYEESLGLSTKSFTFNFSNGRLLGDYLLIPKLNKLKRLLDYIDPKIQPIFGPNSIDAILNRLTEKNTILISGQDITNSGNTLTKTLLTFTEPYGLSYEVGVDYKVVPYGPNYTNSYGIVDSSYDLAFKQSGMTSYYLNYSATNNAINTSGSGITLYNTAIYQPTTVTAGYQKVYVYIFDEDESRTYTDLTYFNNSQPVDTNFIPCYPTTLLHASGTTLSDISSGLLESISYGFRNNSVTYSKRASLAQGSIKPTGMLSVTYTGSTNFSLSAKKGNSWSVTISDMIHYFTLGTNTNGNATPSKLNGKSGTTTTTVYFYTTNNSLIVSGSTSGKFAVSAGTVVCQNYAALSLYNISGNTTYKIVTKTILTFSPAYSQTANSYDIVSCRGSFNVKYTKPGLFFNFNVGSTAYSPVYYGGTTYYYPALCIAGFRAASKSILNGAITKEGFSFTSKKFLMVDGVPRACNSSYFLSGNVILLPSYIKGEGSYCLYIGARKITQRILDRSYGVHTGELTFTTDYVCSKSFKSSAWSSYTQPNIAYAEIYSLDLINGYPSIVGRNLLRNTEYWKWGPSSNQYNFSAITPTIGFKPSTIYTFSAESIQLSSGDKVHFAIFDSTIQTCRQDKNFVIKKTGDSNKYCFTFRTLSTVTSTDKFLIYSGEFGSTSGVTLTLRHFKLEEGACATDWSPAPEDSGAFLDMPFKCSDALATANDITEKVCCLFAPSYRLKCFSGSDAPLSNIYNYLLSKTESTIYDNICSSGGVGYIDKLDADGISGSIGDCFYTRYVDIVAVSNSSTSSIGQAIRGCYTSNEYNIRTMTYPTFKSPTATTITYVDGLCIPFTADRLVIVNLNNYNEPGNFEGTYSLYYHDGCVSNDYSAQGYSVSGYIGYASGYLGVDVILPNDANGSSINEMYLGLIDESLNNPNTSQMVSGTIGTLGLVMCDKSEKIPTVERVFRKNTINDVVSYQCYGIMKFDFDKMLYYMDTSVYIKIIDNNYSFNTVALSEDFCYKFYFCNEQISSEIIYPLSYDTILETTHIKPTLYVTEDMAELNFRIYETNKIPFNATGVFLKIGFSFPLERVGPSLSYFETDIMNVSDILLQQGYTQQDDVFMYIPSLGSSEFANNRSPSIQYATRAGGGYSGNQTGLKLVCSTVSSTTVNYGARWTASSLTKLKNLTGTSQSTCVKSGTSVITTAIIMATTTTTTSISANPLNYNSVASPLAGTLNMQNKAIEVWYLMHGAVSNAPSGTISYISNYNGTTISKSRTTSNMYTTYLDTLPTYIFGGFRPADNTSYLLKNYLIKYLGISYLNDAGYNNLFQ